MRNQPENGSLTDILVVTLLLAAKMISTVVSLCAGNACGLPKGPEKLEISLHKSEQGVESHRFRHNEGT